MQAVATELSAGRQAAIGPWLYLDEITHRAVNEYAAMLAVVRRAARSVSDHASAHALEEVAARLQAAAVMNRALQPAQGDGPQNLDRDLEALCAGLSASILAGRPIRLTLLTEPVVIGARRSWQVCLIVSELVTNALRHAFTRCSEGSITIKLGLTAGRVYCAVSDDGVAAPIVRPGRGTTIVDALAADLGGIVLRRHSGRGSCVVLSFPLAAEG
jgi:two-component sensor histidine kinase